ncbi:MAG TPA: peptide chain release factor 1 [Caldisericia bacterium]|nr:peptide chain release factor 1 [Caldisericia bacterium]HPF48218.1 peptide chain release factor 1 [Caldisericia bacterium]HPI83846.1 peptide chain release factor 1 [Caldisericia bacterium]HPQ92671.1 peptide chain release factor 1 [Caldisericia bacterium]HRV74231.1 peptide chain release factor 1 [Caldisericia bacterium]
MIKKAQGLIDRYNEVIRQLSEPGIMSDPEKFKKLSKEQADISGVVQTALKLQELEKEIGDTKQLMDSDDAGMKELAVVELERLEEEHTQLSQKLNRLLIPKDPRDEKSVIMEIRAAAGGEESALFAAELFRAYSLYAQAKRWKFEVINSNATDIGGFKEVIFSIEGKNVYRHLKYESGVHRVQRVPETESGGRIHTSTITVAVMQEAEEVDIEIKPEDLKIDVYRSSGHGGQCVQTTDSAVRVTHIPTGMIVTCQDERSQTQNKERAIKVLRARLYELEQAKKDKEHAESRRVQIGSGDRAEKIRTYNYPQTRVSDHRINFTVYRLPEIMMGNLDIVINALIEAEEQKKLDELATSSTD